VVDAEEYRKGKEREPVSTSETPVGSSPTSDALQEATTEIESLKNALSAAHIKTQQAEAQNKIALEFISKIQRPQPGSTGPGGLFGELIGTVRRAVMGTILRISKHIPGSQLAECACALVENSPEFVGGDNSQSGVRAVEDALAQLLDLMLKAIEESHRRPSRGQASSPPRSGVRAGHSSYMNETEASKARKSPPRTRSPPKGNLLRHQGRSAPSPLPASKVSHKGEELALDEFQSALKQMRQ